MKRFSPWLALLFCSIFLISCQYDNEEELYGKGGDCDTSNVTYSQTIKPILTASCYTCHSTGNAPSFGSGINLENYNELMIRVNNGKLVGAISHSPGYSAMPQAGTKLDDCTIEKIKTWINNGALND